MPKTLKYIYIYIYIFRQAGMCFHTLSSFLCHADYEEFIKTFWRVNTTGNIYLLIFSTILVLHKVMNLRYNAARFDLNVELPLIL